MSGDLAPASPAGDGPTNCDVAIVGAGPVGLVLSILLAQHGHTVVVLERWPQPYPLPRAVHFDHEVGRILQGCGIGDELRAISEPAEIYEWRNAEGTTLLRFGRIGASRSGWPQSSMFCQPQLEALLETRATSLPTIDFRRGVEVVSVTDGDGVIVGDASGTTVRARYAVGCDGANSTVRRLAGIEMCDLGFFHDWLIVDVVLDEPRVYDPLNVQICDPARPTTVVSGGPGRRRWEFMRLPGESRDELDDERTAWSLLAAWDVTPDNARLERHALYTFQARHASRWRDGRVLLAGDAAHQMPPFAGQGMCAGVRDAANLAWKLDLVLAGHAADDLLDSYETERLPSARQAIEFSMELGKVICVADPAEAEARDEAMAAAVTGELSDVPDLPGIDEGIVDAGSIHAGRLLGQFTVASGPTATSSSRRRWFDDVHGVGWRLITTEPTPSVEPRIARWFEGIGGRIVAVDHADADATSWWTALGARWALQRPDFHLYGTADDAHGADRLLTSLRQRLTAGAPTTEGAAT